MDFLRFNIRRHQWACVILSLLITGFTGPAWGHGHDEDEHEIARLMAFYNQVVDFSERVRAPSAAIPYWNLGQKVSAEGPLADLVRSKLRLWHSTLRAECGDCVPVDPAVWEEEAKALVAKGFMRTKVGDKILGTVEHIGLGTADIAAELGIAPGVEKGVLEAAESFLALAKWGGAHVFCHVFDAIILFSTRPLLTMWRTFNWAPTVGSSRAATFARLGLISAAVRRAESRVEFVRGPVELSPEDVAEIDKDGQNRFWGWIKPGKRAKWLNKLNLKGVATLDGRAYRGRGMKRYAYLLRRRRGHADHLKGSSPMDDALNHDVVWAFAVQENIVQPAFKPSDQPSAVELATLVNTYTPETDDVRAGIAARFGKGNERRTELMSEILREVEVVFNPDVSRRVRYFQAKKIEAILSGFVRGNFLSTLHEAGELYSNDADSFFGKFVAIMKRARLHFRAGRFTHYMLSVGDYLRTAALSTNGEQLVRKKFETMDSVRRIFETLQLSGDLSNVKTLEDLMGIEQKLMNRRKELLAFRPWVEKSISFSWLPFRNLKPLCLDMNRSATQ